MKENKAIREFFNKTHMEMTPIGYVTTNKHLGSEILLEDLDEGLTFYKVDIEKIPRTNEKFVHLLEEIAKDAEFEVPQVLFEAMKIIDRKNFIPEEAALEIVYNLSKPAPIGDKDGFLGHTCSAMNILVLLGAEGLRGLPDNIDIAELKTGNAYFSSLLAKSTSGKVVSFNVFPELEGVGEKNVNSNGYILDNLTIESYHKIGRNLILNKYFNKFDLLVSRVTLSSEQLSDFFMLLKDNGRLIAPVDALVPCDAKDAFECAHYQMKGMCVDSEEELMMQSGLYKYEGSASNYEILSPSVRFSNLPE